MGGRNRYANLTGQKYSERGSNLNGETPEKSINDVFFSEVRQNCNTNHMNMAERHNYVDGVIFVRSLPTVSMTRRPHSHNPTEIPTPPKTNSETGVSDFCKTVPSA